MYCPNCGNETSADHRFCRSCGLSLEKIVQSLVEQLPAKLDESLRERKNKLEQLGVVALSIFGLGVLGFIIFRIGYKLMLTQGTIVAGLALLGLIIILGCGVLSVVLFAKAKEVEEASTKRQIQQASESTKSETTKGLVLEAGGDQVASVTERTTELFRRGDERK
jgi:zinc ribbon protein